MDGTSCTRPNPPWPPTSTSIFRSILLRSSVPVLSRGVAPALILSMRFFPHEPRTKIAMIDAAVRSILGPLARAAHVIAPPLLRIALAVPFFRSGLGKWNGFLSLSPAASFLFEDEFKLHIFGEAYDFPAPELVAFVVGTAEIVLPTLLVVGLATRFSALGLL